MLVPCEPLQPSDYERWNRSFCGVGFSTFSNRIAVKVFVFEIHVHEVDGVIARGLQREKGNNWQRVWKPQTLYWGC